MSELWQRIAGHAFPDGFLSRIARENGWSLHEAAQALEEYRRYVFLACTAREEATPSKTVDAVWHAHLLYTKDYWLEFCPNVLRRELHHSPGDGGSRDAQRHAAQYERTLREYERQFGAPPQRWWPRREPVSKSSVAAASLTLAAAPALALAAARPANPLEWNGPEFLVLYVVSLVVVVVASLALRAVLRRSGEAERSAGKLGMLDYAYLAGGASRTVDAAVADLHRRGALHWDDATRRFERRATAHALEPQLEAMANALASSVDGAARQAELVRTHLERHGLWQRREDARRIGRWSALPALLLLGFGLAKVAIGLERDRPVTALVVLCVITAVFALIMLANRAGPTRAGRVALAGKRAEQRVASRGRGLDDLGLAVALGGTVLLADTALAGYHQMRQPATSSSDSSSSSSSSDSGDSSGGSDSGGGSSCGGCGGGGGD